VAVHVLFGLSLLVQLILAAHAYRHGRTSPWIWIILFFPVAGSALYAILFLLPASPRRVGPRRFRQSERKLRRVERGPFAPSGERPDTAIPVASVAEDRVEALDGREASVGRAPSHLAWWQARVDEDARSARLDERRIAAAPAAEHRDPHRGSQDTLFCGAR
jgi:hypothetical protein